MPAAIRMHRSTRGSSRLRRTRAGLLFLPFLYGSSVGADATGCLVGLSARHDRRHIARAVYEGVVFGHRLHLERLLAVRAMPADDPRQRRGARSDVWMQMAADVFQCPVEVPDGNELGALGAAMCAAVAVGTPRRLSGGVRGHDALFPALRAPGGFRPDLCRQVPTIHEVAPRPRTGLGRSRLERESWASVMKPATFIAACALSAGSHRCWPLGRRDARESRAAGGGIARDGLSR